MFNPTQTKLYVCKYCSPFCLVFSEFTIHGSYPYKNPTNQISVPLFYVFSCVFSTRLTSPFSPSPPACPASHDPHAVEVAVRLQDIPCRLQAVLVALHLGSDGFAGENQHLLTQQEPAMGDVGDGFGKVKFIIVYTCRKPRFWVEHGLTPCFLFAKNARGGGFCEFSQSFLELDPKKNPAGHEWLRVFPSEDADLLACRSYTYNQ